MRAFIATAMLTSGLMLGACATVEMIPGGSDEAQVTLDSADRLALRRTAKTLSYDFAQNGWVSARDEKSAQSAASVLLGGMKPKAEAPGAQDIYIQASASIGAIKADIFAAGQQVRSLADMAVTVLAADPDAAALRKDLRAMETALITARKAEMTFDAALSAKGSLEASADMLDLSDRIDALRTVTDAIGDRSRSVTLPDASS